VKKSAGSRTSITVTGRPRSNIRARDDGLIHVTERIGLATAGLLGEVVIVRNDDATTSASISSDLLRWQFDVGQVAGYIAD
jgi:hypothetical protein